jgi:hypothetical protein
LTRFEVDRSSDSEQPRLVSWNETAPVEEGGEAVTAEPEHAEPDQGSDQQDEQLARMSNDLSN